MAGFQDQTYLLQSQYKDEANFSARVNLRRRFGVNKYGWHRWIFDHFQLDEGSQVLELGCGPGLLWFSNRQRIPASWRIVVSDFSAGMLQAARQRLGEERFSFQVVDAQAIPFPDESLDAVIANHMLYHMPDLPRALAEIQRVLKPGGYLYTTTIGQQHMQEMGTLLQQIWPNIPRSVLGRIADTFGLENGQAILAPFFADVDLDIYEDAFEISEAEPLIAYMLSGSLRPRVNEAKLSDFRALVEQELATHGTIHMTSASGIFVARKALQSLKL